MDKVDILHAGRYMYWSEVLCWPTSETLSSRFIDFNRYSGKAQVGRATQSCGSAYFKFWCYKRFAG